VVGGVIALAGFVVRDVLQEWRDKKKAWEVQPW